MYCTGVETRSGTKSTADWRSAKTSIAGESSVDHEDDDRLMVNKIQSRWDEIGPDVEKLSLANDNTEAARLLQSIQKSVS